MSAHCLLITGLFAVADAIGSRMAGRTEEGIGEPETVALAASILTNDLLTALGRQARPSR